MWLYGLLGVLVVGVAMTWLGLALARAAGEAERAAERLWLQQAAQQRHHAAIEQCRRQSVETMRRRSAMRRAERQPRDAA